MLTSLRHNLSNLLQFSGRTRRQDFWLYAMVVVLLAFAAWAVIFEMVFSELFGRIQRFAAQHPELVHETRGPGSYSVEVEGFHPELMPDFSILLLGMGAIVAVAILLLAASVTRRLHDRGKSGWWGLLPVVFLAIGFALFPNLIASFKSDAPNFQLFALLFLNNFVYLGTLVLLVVFLASPGTPGSNRYGDPA